MDKQSPEDTSAAAETTSLPDVLELVLQRSCLGDDVKTCCRLLETSHAVASASARHLSRYGRLELDLHLNRPGRAEAVAPWIARHGRGIGKILMCCSLEEATPDTVADAIAAGAPVLEALQRAAASEAAARAAAPRLPLLQHLRLLHVAPDTAVPLLQMVPQLTQLFINIEYGLDQDDANAPGAAQVAEAVAALPGLKDMFLCNSAAAVLPALSSSSNTALADLEVDVLPDMSLLQALPEQLQELRINNVADNSIWSPDAPGWVQLAHCTALTSLEIPGAPFGSDASLPGSLVNLHVAGIYSSCQPLLGLQQLQRLHLGDVAPSLDLQPLTALQQLSRVELSYYDAPLAATSQAWGALPVSSLSFPAPPPVAGHQATPDHLGQTGGSLKHLRLDMHASVEEEPVTSAWPVPLAEALSKLTQLTSLWLKTERTAADEDFGLGLGWGGDFAGSIMTELANAIAGLHSLQSLSLGGPFWDGVVPQLQGTSAQLTCLELRDCSFSGETLAGLMQQFSQLRSLQLGGCRIGVLENESLAAFVSRVPQLTRLEL